MTVVSLEKAQAQLADLLARAEAGEEIIITRAERPSLKLTLVSPPMVAPSKLQPSRHSGRMKGQFTVPDSVFDPLPEDEVLLWEEGCDLSPGSDN